MKYVNKKESIVLFLGDLLILLDSLWIAMAIRYFEIPKRLWNSDLFWSFSILSLIWILSFYIAGLYQKHTLILKGKISSLLLKAQITNIVIAVMFFYFIPYFQIAPKTILFIYLVVSSALIYVWRIFIFKFIRPYRKESAILIGSGDDMKKLVHEINNNNRYGFKIVNIVDLDSETNPNLENLLQEKIERHNITLIITDTKHLKIENLLPKLYNLFFSSIEFLDFQDVYEEIFDQIPISNLNHLWLIDNIKVKKNIFFNLAKRLSDIFFSLIILIPSLLIYPFVMLAIYLESRVNPFIVQERVGRNNKKIRILKFRSMTVNDKGNWPTKNDERITRVGKFIRNTRIDELPQILNVLKGDLSLIGPRPDIVGLYNNLSKEISYYKIRNLVKPGLSGWAQTHQEVPPHSVEETKNRLAYDLYYIKNQSLLLDFKIAIQTFRILVSRTGR